MDEHNSEMPAGYMGMQDEAVSPLVSEDTGTMPCNETGLGVMDEMKSMPETSSDFPGMEEMYAMPDVGSDMSGAGVSMLMPEGQMPETDSTGMDMLSGEVMSMTSAGNTVNLPGTWKLSLTQILH